MNSMRWAAGTLMLGMALGTCSLAARFPAGGAERELAPPRPGVDAPKLTSGAMVFPTRLPDGYKLQYEQRFNTEEALKEFVFTDPQAWRFAPTNEGGMLELARQSQYKPAVRSPVNIALLADRVFGDFVLEVNLIQTGKEYGHRDMCLFYGVQDPTHFYYTHIATVADDHAHNTFIVTNAPRIKIARETTRGANWGLGIWHTVRIERSATKGTIKVFFDDRDKPIMVADDKTFGAGYIGFGSFDDTGMIDNIRIWAPSMEERRTTFYRRRE
jgi:hypothetical protein